MAYTTRGYMRVLEVRPTERYLVYEGHGSNIRYYTLDFFHAWSPKLKQLFSE